MKNEKIIKALEGYPGAFLAKIIWGVDFEVLSKSEKQNYRTKIGHRKKTGKFYPHEMNSIVAFLTAKKQDIAAVLNCG